MNVRQGNHGYSGTKLYNSWRGMKQRCYDNSQIKINKTYEGIVVCNDWHRFLPFKNWALSNGYEEGLTIERKNPKDNYHPQNCEWVNKGENSRRRNLSHDYSKNKITGRTIETINGDILRVKEYCKLKSLVFNSFRAKLNGKPMAIKEIDLDLDKSQNVIWTY